MSGPMDRTIDPRGPLAYAPKWARGVASAERHKLAKQSSGSELSGLFRPESDHMLSAEQHPAPPSLEPIGLPSAPILFARFSPRIVALGVAAAAIAVVLTMAKWQWPVVAKDDDEDVASFDARFIERTPPTIDSEKANFLTAYQRSGLRVATRSENKDAVSSGALGEQAARTRTGPVPAAPTLNAEDIAILFNRGRELLATGDIAAARVSLLRAAEAGDAEAALMLASTFDPVALKNIGIYGMVAADISLARTWYEKAKEFGSQEASRRLRRLADRVR
jgi:TPR repeat protein